MILGTTHTIIRSHGVWLIIPVYRLNVAGDSNGTYRLVEWKEIGAGRETADIKIYDYTFGMVERISIAGEHSEIIRELRAIPDQQPVAHPVHPQGRR